MISARQPVDCSPLLNLKSNTNTIVWFILGGILLLMVLPFPLVILLGADSSALISVIILGGIIAGSVWGWKRYVALRNYNRGVKTEFARVNGFQYTPQPHFDGGAGTIFTHGHSRRASELFAGQFNGLPFELFNYYYETGSGKSRRVWDALVMEFTLPRKLPHMVIDSVVESLGASTLPIQFDRKQRIELEGDFHKYFDLYAPDSYGISALTVLAPDAMDVLMRHAALCDIEIIDDKLYFYWPDPAHSSVSYEDVFRTTGEVLDKIGDKLARGDIFAHASQAQVHAEATGNGVRLKKSPWGGILTIGFVVMYVAAQFAETSPYVAIVFVAAFLVIIPYALIQSARKNRLRNELLERYQRAK